MIGIWGAYFHQGNQPAPRKCLEKSNKFYSIFSILEYFFYNLLYIFFFIIFIPYVGINICYVQCRVKHFICILKIINDLLATLPYKIKYYRHFVPEQTFYNRVLHIIPYYDIPLKSYIILASSNIWLPSYKLLQAYLIP